MERASYQSLCWQDTPCSWHAPSLLIPEQLTCSPAEVAAPAENIVVSALRAHLPLSRDAAVLHPPDLHHNLHAKVAERGLLVHLFGFYQE